MFKRFKKVVKEQQVEKQASSYLLEPLEPRILLSAEIGVPPQDMEQDLLLADTSPTYEQTPEFNTPETSEQFATGETVEPTDGQSDVDELDESEVQVDANTDPGERIDKDETEVTTEKPDTIDDIVFTAQDLYQFTQQMGSQLVFVDPSVPDYESLIAKVSVNDAVNTESNSTGIESDVHNIDERVSHDQHTTSGYIDLSTTGVDESGEIATHYSDNRDQTTQIFVLDSTRDGLEQITEVLAQFEDISAVHVLSHGAAGYLRLGNSTINQSNLNNYQNQLRQWGNSLTESADVLLYGCDVANGQSGVDFVTRISAMTGADVAASTDASGGANGDWVLEHTNGDIEANALFTSANDYQHVLADIIGAADVDDTLVSLSENDTLTGLTGNDTYQFADGWGTDTVVEATGEGIDTLDFSAVTSELTFTIHADGSMSVTDGTNTVTAAASIENLTGGSGTNLFVFEQGATLVGNIDGGTGTATLDYSAWTDVVNANLLTGAASGITGSISNINNINGGSNNDILIGDDNGNRITGGAGADLIIAGAGNDIVRGGTEADAIYGGTGDDLLEGGTGDDTYYFESDFGFDTVNDSGNDPLNRTAGTAGDTWDFSAIRTQIDFYSGSYGYLNGEFTRVVNQTNYVTETIANPFAVETIIGGNDADTFNIYQTADYGADPGNNILLLDGHNGSDTYIANFAPGYINVPMQVAIRDTGNSWDTDTAIANGSDNADVIDVNETEVRVGTQVFAYGVYGTESGLEALEVNALQGHDQIFIESTPDYLNVTVNGNEKNSDTTPVEDNDVIIVGRNSTATSGGTLDEIKGKSTDDRIGVLEINGNEGSDTLFIDDSADLTGDIGILTDTRISGLDMQADIEYATIETLGTSLSQGNDNLTVVSTIGGASYISGNDGRDVVDIQNATGLVEVYGGNDEDSITLQSNNTASRVALFGEDGNDVINVRRMIEPVTVRGGDDNDIINVGSGAPVTGGVVDYISDLLDVDGEAGTDILNVDDSGDTDDNDLLVTNTLLTGLDMSDGIQYAGMEFINIATGSGSEKVDVQSTALNSLTTISTNDGDASINVSSDAPANGGTLDGIQGELSLLMGSGVNELNISDIASTSADDNIVITNSRITGLAPAAINYSTTGRYAHGVNIWFGEGSDTAEIESTHSDSVTTVWANDGNDDITATDNSPGEDGLLVVHGEAGDDTIDASAWNNRTILFGDFGTVSYTSDDRRIETLSRVATVVSDEDGNDTLSGGSNDDQLYGSKGSDRLLSHNGNDILHGDGGQTRYEYGATNRMITEATSFFTGSDDFLDGGAGQDIMLGGFGHDTFVGNLAEDTMFGEYGRVTIDDGLGKTVIRLGQEKLDIIASTMFGLFNPGVLAFGPGAISPVMPVGSAETAFEAVFNAVTVKGGHNANDLNPAPEPPAPPVKTPAELAFEQTLVTEPPAGGKLELQATEPQAKEPEIICKKIQGATLGVSELWDQLLDSENINQAVGVANDILDVFLSGKPKKLADTEKCAPVMEDVEENSDELQDPQSALELPVFAMGGLLGMQAYSMTRKPSKSSVNVDRAAFDQLERENDSKRYSRWQ
ncbi:MAG: DUF4347 domain-containing protein [Gammaproteobacteria bacterium]|nr:DUF4347 domain-containing protein [Gammaproteobacteria bacterium]